MSSPSFKLDLDELLVPSAKPANAFHLDLDNLRKPEINAGSHKAKEAVEPGEAGDFPTSTRACAREADAPVSPPDTDGEHDFSEQYARAREATCQNPAKPQVVDNFVTSTHTREANTPNLKKPEIETVAERPAIRPKPPRGGWRKAVYHRPRCPNCGSADTFIRSSRPDGETVHREYRICRVCDARFTAMGI